MDSGKTETSVATLFNKDTDVFSILVFMADKISELTDRGDVILKGGTALMDRLLDSNPELARYTHDIDLYIKNEETYNLIFNSIEDVLNNNSLGLKFVQIGHRGRRGTGEGYIFTVMTKWGERYDVGIDLQVSQMGKISTTSGYKIKLPVYDNYTMLADKISVASSRAIFRRIKDLYDIYALSKLQNYSMHTLVQATMGKRPEMKETMAIMFRTDTVEQLQHAYDKFEGILNKPEFRDIYKITSNFVVPVLVCISEGGTTEYTWKAGGSSWLRER